MLQKYFQSILLFAVALSFVIAGCDHPENYTSSFSTDQNHNPYIRIIRDADAIKLFLHSDFWNPINISIDDIWIPGRNDLYDIDFALKVFLKNKIQNEKDSWQRTCYNHIFENLDEYNREYSGFKKGSRKFVFCNMNLFNDYSANGGFTSIDDGGTSVVRFVYDVQEKRIIRMEWNGEA